VAPDPSAFAATFHADYSSNGDLGSKFGQQSIRGAVNTPIGQNSAVRVSAYGTRVEGVQHNTALNKDNETENYGVRARYRWTPTDALAINLIADYNDQTVDGADFFTYLTAPVATNPRTGLLANCGITPGFGNQNYCSNRMADSHAKNYGSSAQIDFETTGPTLTSISGYRRIDTSSDYGEISRLIGDVPQIFFRNQLSSAHQFTQELRVSSPEDAAFDYVAGAYYSRYEFGNGVAGGSGGFNLVFPWPNTAPQCVFGGACSTVNGFTPSEVQNESLAGFADATFHVSDALRVFGGLRYTEQTIDATSGARSDTLDESNVSGRLGAAYRLSPSTMFYASAARGYKGPVFFVSADPSVPSSSVNAEIPTSYEIGAKWSLLDNRLAFDANVFYSEVKDYQAQVCTTSALGALQCRPTNVPKVESQGIELDVIGQPFDGLTLSAGLIYNPVEYPDGFLGSDGTNLGGKQLALAPKEKFVLSGEYSHPLFGEVDGFIALDTVYKSELRLSDSANPLYTYPSSWQFGASLGLRGGQGQWTVSLFGRNLTDENIPLTVFGTNPSAGLWGWPIPNQTLRQVGLTADFRF
jgi:iron complex outermembrane recepter protein